MKPVLFLSGLFIFASLAMMLIACQPPDHTNPDSPENDGGAIGFDEKYFDPPIEFSGRLIPLRIVGFVCEDADWEMKPDEVQLSIDAANEVYKPLGIRFYVEVLMHVKTDSIYCKSGQYSWMDVKGIIRQIYPHIPEDAWDDNLTKPGDTSSSSNWLQAAIAIYGNENEIFVIVDKTRSSNNSDSPNSGRGIGFMPHYWGNFPSQGSGTLNMFAHELGHYLGTVHVWLAQGGKDPVTGNNWDQTYQWDLVYIPSHNGPLFFNDQINSDYIDQLENIVKRRSKPPCVAASDCDDGYSCTTESCVGEISKKCYYDLTDCGWPSDGVSNCIQMETNGQQDGRIKCVMAVSKTSPTGIETWLPYTDSKGSLFIYETGDIPLLGLAFDSEQTPNPPHTLRYGRNVMDYGEMTGPRGLANSQQFIMGRNLNYELASSSSFLNRVGAFPKEYSKEDVRSARSKLGIIRDHWSDETLTFCANSGDMTYVGDFNDDGRDDLLCNGMNKSMTIYLSDYRGRFENIDWYHQKRDFCMHTGETLYVGDFDGINGDDLLCNNSDNGAMRVDRVHVGGEFFMDSDWVNQRDFCTGPLDKLVVGDFNDDGRDDILCNKLNGDMQIDLSNTKGEFWSIDWEMKDREFCMHGGERLYVGNFDGKRGDDLLCNNVFNGMIRVDLSEEDEFFPGSDFKASRTFCNGDQDELIVLDFNGDRRDDILCRNKVTGYIEVDVASRQGEFLATDLATAFNRWCAGTENSIMAGHFDDFLYRFKNYEDILCKTPTGGLWIEYSAFDQRYHPL